MHGALFSFGCLWVLIIIVLFGLRIAITRLREVRGAIGTIADCEPLTNEPPVRP